MPWWMWIFGFALILAAYILVGVFWLLWQLLRLLWFILAVVPFRVIAGIRDGRYNNSVGRAEDRMQQYLNDNKE
jgi:hypothetical protein